MEKTQAVIPPDALYATTTKKLQNRNSFYAPPPINSMHPQQQSPSSYAFNDPSFNDSKVRIHTFSRKNHFPINSSSLNQHHIVSNHYVNTTGSTDHQNGFYNWQHAVILMHCSTMPSQEQHAWILQE